MSNAFCLNLLPILLLTKSHIPNLKLHFYLRTITYKVLTTLTIQIAKII